MTAIVIAIHVAAAMIALLAAIQAAFAIQGARSEARMYRELSGMADARANEYADQARAQTGKLIDAREEIGRLNERTLTLEGSLGEAYRQIDAMGQYSRLDGTALAELKDAMEDAIGVLIDAHDGVFGDLDDDDDDDDDDGDIDAPRPGGNPRITLSRN